MKTALIAVGREAELGEAQRNENGQRAEHQRRQRDEPQAAEDPPVVERRPEIRDRLAVALRRCGREQRGDRDSDRDYADRP